MAGVAAPTSADAATIQTLWKNDERKTIPPFKGIDDLSLLAARWLDTTCHECDRADLTGNGCVDMKDLAELARAFMTTSNTLGGW